MNELQCKISLCLRAWHPSDISQTPTFVALTAVLSPFLNTPAIGGAAVRLAPTRPAASVKRAATHRLQVGKRQSV